ncbi:MAG: hypothetical protein COT74_09110 [Bdellovibrionales bacterium CG10_big_fil_rev_8_21_14_0_10_45_34]|nr:MAG: hypothetical protein COT74_09110 [Bdellovibrionales bacterium CG10_big_fil_rev_8_21_14_0_10_45_34]
MLGSGFTRWFLVISLLTGISVTYKNCAPAEFRVLENTAPQKNFGDGIEPGGIVGPPNLPCGDIAHGDVFEEATREEWRAGDCGTNGGNLQIHYRIWLEYACNSGTTGRTQTPAREEEIGRQGACNTEPTTNCGSQSNGSVWTVDAEVKEPAICLYPGNLMNVYTDKTEYRCDQGIIEPTGNTQRVGPIRQEGSCGTPPPVGCGDRAHGEIWQESGDPAIAVGECLYGGSLVTTHQTSVQKTCDNGTISQIGEPELVEPGVTTGSCNSAPTTNCADMEHDTSRSKADGVLEVPQSCQHGGNLVFLFERIIKDTCFNTQMTTEVLKGNKIGETGACNPPPPASCGNHPHGSTWWQDSEERTEDVINCTNSESTITELFKKQVEYRCDDGSSSLTGNSRPGDLVSRTGECPPPARDCGDARKHLDEWYIVEGTTKEPKVCEYDSSASYFDIYAREILYQCFDGTIRPKPQVDPRKGESQGTEGSCAPKTCGNNSHGSSWTQIEGAPIKVPEVCAHGGNKFKLYESLTQYSCNNGQSATSGTSQGSFIGYEGACNPPPPKDCGSRKHLTTWYEVEGTRKQPLSCPYGGVLYGIYQNLVQYRCDNGTSTPTGFQIPGNQISTIGSCDAEPANHSCSGIVIGQECVTGGSGSNSCRRVEVSPGETLNCLPPLDTSSSWSFARAEFYHATYGDLNDDCTKSSWTSGMFSYLKNSPLPMGTPLTCFENRVQHSPSDSAPNFNQAPGTCFQGGNSNRFGWDGTWWKDLGSGPWFCRYPNNHKWRVNCVYKRTCN